MTHDQLDLIRQVTGTPTPTDEQRQAARAALRACIADEQRGVGRRRRPRAMAVAAGILIVVVGAAGVISLRTPKATAGLLELAEATRRVAPIELTRDQAIYTTTETTTLAIIFGGEIGIDDQEIAYLLPSRRETWTLGDGIVMRTTVGTPAFFSDRAEAAYYAAGRDQIDRVGETFEEAFTGISDPVTENDWPTTTAALHQAMADWVNLGGSPLPEDVQVFKLAGTILRAQPTRPELRAAVIEVLANLATSTTQNPDAGTLTASISYLDGDVNFTDSLTFDRDGYLIGDQTTAQDPISDLEIPAGTVIGEGRYSVPLQVKGVGEAGEPVNPGG